MNGMDMDEYGYYFVWYTKDKNTTVTVDQTRLLYAAMRKNIKA